MENSYLATIKVVGIGGGGVNAVNRMVDVGLNGVEFIAINTDAQHLILSDADVKLDIGRELTNGLGAGADPNIGKQSAEDSENEIEEVLRGADMVFITAGEGGGTGTGGAPVVARIAHDQGALTVGVVTKPFAFEGKRRMKQAEAGIEELKKEVDALIVIPNERLRRMGDKNLSFSDAYRLADENLMKNVQAITEIITKVGEQNVDFADVTSVIKGSGTAIIGIGQAHGEDRAIKATEQAISSPLLEASIDGARGVIFCAFGSQELLTLDEVGEASTLVEEASHPEVNKIDGIYWDDTLGEDIRVIVIATGFDNSQDAGLSQISKTFSAPNQASKIVEEVVSTPAEKKVSAPTSTSINGTVSAPTSTGTNSEVSARSGYTQKITDFESSSGFTSESIFNSSGGVNQSGSLSVLSGQLSAVSGEVGSAKEKFGDNGRDEHVEGRDNLDIPDFLND
ncbi:MAG: cell division protein FtsZ [Candidatus Ancillula trichonymphae]|jgi:cell division protein FtsZ|nr:cell division protein FtsZ [Candidatus Ancillula trichonymphae]